MNDAWCKLDSDGRVVEYDYAVAIGNTHPDATLFEYIGDGVVHSVRGVMQSGYTRLSFFKVIKKKRHYRTAGYCR